DLHTVWHDHAFPNEPRYDPEIYPFFLRLMEKYDVCYRLTDGKASLVAQHVPQVRPELPWLPEQETPKNLRRIAMVCSMEEDPPGLVPWMIVRTHDYAYPVNAHSLHWQKGMFLSHGTHGTAMLEQRGREFHVYTQGQWPEYFMNILQNTLEKMIADNWPGLKDRYRFMVPCPEVIDGQPCKGRFNIYTLREILADGDTTIRCQECVKKQSITELLMGFEERDMSVQLREIQEQLAGMDSRIANYFMATMHAIADEAKSGPRLFTFRSRDAGLSPKQIFMRPISLQLWCEAEGCQHPIIDNGKGLYSIDQPHEWVMKIAPYANMALDILKTVAPVAGPAINTFFGPKTTELWGIADQLSLASAVLGKVPDEIKTPDKPMLQRGMVSEPERSGILALHRLLNELDPNQENLGLHRVATYTGDYRWLCKRHYDAYQPNIPDKIG
ncbi:MAG TPA: COR domain-containing protein, partial [Anaerolineales bacterium]|nr:COR domain-containing protein [Anaerolineales bacterium]